MNTHEHKHKQPSILNDTYVEKNKKLDKLMTSLSSFMNIDPKLFDIKMVRTVSIRRPSVWVKS